MAASDKLLPTAIAMANNLRGTRFASSNTYGLPAKKSSRFKNPYVNAVEFFASIYAKELRIATGNPTWNHKLVNGKNLTVDYTPNFNIHELTLGNVIAFSEFEWDELQITISRGFNIVYPFDIVGGPWTPAEILAYNTLMGVDDGGVAPLRPLLGADSSPLGVFPQGTVWADAWNTIKVPYDLTIGVVTPFIAPIFQPLLATKFYYRFTGNRRWFGFAGYNLM